MNPIDLRDVVAALVPALPVIALFMSMIVGCLVTRNWAAPRVRKTRLARRLQELDAVRAGKHLAVVGKTPTLLVSAGDGWFHGAADRAVNLLRSPSGRVAAHVGACMERAGKLALALDGVAPEHVVAEARRLHQHLVGLHESLTRGDR